MSLEAINNSLIIQLHHRKNGTKSSPFESGFYLERPWPIVYNLLVCAAEPIDNAVGYKIDRQGLAYQNLQNG